MRKTILTLIALAVLALFVVSCKPTVGPGQAIAGTQEPNWVPLHQCYEQPGSGKYDYFYTTDINCNGQTLHAKNIALVSTTPFPGSILISECQRIYEEKVRDIWGNIKSRRRYGDKYLVRGKSCDLGGEFIREVGNIYANKAAGTSAFYRCRADEFDRNVWDCWASLNPNCPSERLGRNVNSYLLGYVPTTLAPSPPTIEVPEEPEEFSCKGTEARLDIREGEDFLIKELNKEYYVELIFSTSNAAKFIFNGEATDLIKASDSVTSKDGLVELTLMRAKDDRAEFCLTATEKAGPCADYKKEIDEIKSKIKDIQRECDEKIKTIQERCVTDTGAKCTDIQREINTLKEEITDYEKLIASLKQLISQ
ncbi:hypothetical protein KY338_00010 [Candidatus Woesearchaeota archaeon]|nr:hypothetical protein [Candidatus Woesearchaeota archaeon]MBW3005295.1 hypothetical protein [Candidatus Woesearchaeota archaeon]